MKITGHVKSYLLLFVLSASHDVVDGFCTRSITRFEGTKVLWSSPLNGDDSMPPAKVAAVPTSSSSTSEKESRNASVDAETCALKQELLSLVALTKRGFEATREQRKQVRSLVDKLKLKNPTKEPASPYYTSPPTSIGDGDDNEGPPTLAGKWTLVYTDAPDITGLDTSRNPFATAKLGRIGQECKPPTIKNVIEWRRPDIASRFNLPFSGNEESRVLQKVVTSGKASPDKPLAVDLEIVGLELESGSPNSVSTDLSTAIRSQGIPAGLLQSNGPLELKGFVTAPFGKFEIQYLDDELRIIKTYQNYLAINIRIQDKLDEWF